MGGEAFFNNTGQIETIFSRVTGSLVSNIHGLLGANGMASLFVLNPIGLFFSPNEQLTIYILPRRHTMKGKIMVGLAVALLLGTVSRSTAATVCTCQTIDGVKVCVGCN